jgi:serine/threonine-protein kinase
MYSLGLILFVLATGRNPFEIRKLTDPLEIARMQVSSGFPMPSTIRATLPESVDSLFVKCTKKNPAERYGSADEFLEEVKVALLQ